ncbi:hypothetical protein O9G_000282 [Rozella allomycis CSF55]|uniref:Uncharacterized protein n=1 Tax=Rozella allomycis (strain CSF55) TaxID=988480 RepID=A0A075AP89_ROZAC|nr:hypothetical protein O9G_000282 [Rozella allomycis CSF55]|eukprot:EPZ31803.1 hypothetical protein O9G_000282 [Rozella allomycis CSF55]
MDDKVHEGKENTILKADDDNKDVESKIEEVSQRICYQYAISHRNSTKIRGHEELFRVKSTSQMGSPETPRRTVMLMDLPSHKRTNSVPANTKSVEVPSTPTKYHTLRVEGEKKDLGRSISQQFKRNSSKSIKKIKEKLKNTLSPKLQNPGSEEFYHLRNENGTIPDFANHGEGSKRMFKKRLEDLKSVSSNDSDISSDFHNKSKYKSNSNILNLDSKVASNETLRSVELVPSSPFVIKGYKFELKNQNNELINNEYLGLLKDYDSMILRLEETILKLKRKNEKIDFFMSHYSEQETNLAQLSETAKSHLQKLKATELKALAIKDIHRSLSAKLKEYNDQIQSFSSFTEGYKRELQNDSINDGLYRKDKKSLVSLESVYYILLSWLLTAVYKNEPKIPIEIMDGSSSLNESAPNSPTFSVDSTRSLKFKEPANTLSAKFEKIKASLPGSNLKKQIKNN